MKYSEFANRIDVEAFEDAVGYEVTETKRDLDLGHCPDPWGLHKNGDTTGKFAINRERRTYNCWVCDRGSLLDLAMAIMDMEVQEAEEWLYQFTVPADQSDDAFMDEIEAILAEERQAAKVEPHFNVHVLDKWSSRIEEMEPWLDERGISLEVAQTFRLGYDDQATRLDPIRNGKRKFEPYSGPSIFFPHFWGLRLMGWQQRWLDDSRPGWVKKYTNTPDFPRESTLYAYEVEDVYLSPHPIVVVESVPTALRLMSLGVPSVSTFGGEVSAEQLRLLRRCHQGLILAPDNDASGRKWLRRTDREIEERAKRIPPARYLARFIQVMVTEPVGELDSGNDLGDLSDPEEVLTTLQKASFFMETDT